MWANSVVDSGFHQELRQSSEADVYDLSCSLLPLDVVVK